VIRRLSECMSMIRGQPLNLNLLTTRPQVRVWLWF
jgi:hypothetical protein